MNVAPEDRSMGPLQVMERRPGVRGNGKDEDANPNYISFLFSGQLHLYSHSYSYSLFLSATHAQRERYSV